MVTTLKRPVFEKKGKVQVISMSSSKVDLEIKKIKEALKEVEAIRAGKFPKKDIHEFLKEL